MTCHTAAISEGYVLVCCYSDLGTTRMPWGSLYPSCAWLILFFSHAVALLRGESLCLLESSSPLSPAFPESSVMQKRLKIALFHHCSQAHCQSPKDKSLVQMPRALAALHLCLLCATMRYQVGIRHILLPFWANKCPFCHKQGFAREWTQEFAYLHGPVFATLSCAHASDISDGQFS